jgi:hypothetical protein
MANLLWALAKMGAVLNPEMVCALKGEALLPDTKTVTRQHYSRHSSTPSPLLANKGVCSAEGSGAEVSGLQPASGDTITVTL